MNFPFSRRRKEGKEQSLFEEEPNMHISLNEPDAVILRSRKKQTGIVRMKLQIIDGATMANERLDGTCLFAEAINYPYHSFLTRSSEDRYETFFQIRPGNGVEILVCVGVSVNELRDEGAVAGTLVDGDPVGADGGEHRLHAAVVEGSSKDGDGVVFLQMGRILELDAVFLSETISSLAVDVCIGVRRTSPIVHASGTR
jgi:hypothetical protein